MFCTNCGERLPDGVKFCPNCGTPSARTDAAAAHAEEWADLFDTESEFGKSYIMGALTDEMIARAEKNIGYKLPPSYIRLLRFQNGGCIQDADCWLTAIYGIGETADAENGLEDMFSNWMDEWEYPNIGIPFGETQSAGHDMYFMDFRKIGADGEPAVVNVDVETSSGEPVIRQIAPNLDAFLDMVLAGELSE